MLQRWMEGTKPLGDFSSIFFLGSLHHNVFIPDELMLTLQNKALIQRVTSSWICSPPFRLPHLIRELPTGRSEQGTALRETISRVVEALEGYKISISKWRTQTMDMSLEFLSTLSHMQQSLLLLLRLLAYTLNLIQMGPHTANKVMIISLISSYHMFANYYLCCMLMGIFWICR